MSPRRRPAEDLATRMLAYRELVEHGHPRISDNARWRLYDHVRGTLHGAVEAPAPKRMQVAIQALYVERTKLSAWIDPISSAQATMPSPADLADRLGQQLEPLAAHPRWREVVARRASDDAALRDLVLDRLPARWDPGWPAPPVPQPAEAIGRYRPVVVVEAHSVVLDAGRPSARSLAADAPEATLRPALSQLAERTGSGALTVFVAPALPHARLAVVLDAMAGAGLNTLGLAVSAPSSSGTSTEVGTLPLLLAEHGAPRAIAGALAAARVVVTISAEGFTIRVDGAPLSAHPGALGRFRERLDLVHRAYPRARTVRLALGDGADVGALVDALYAAIGSVEPPFAAAGFLAGVESVPSATPIGARVDRRAALASPTEIAVDQPFPLARGDQSKLEAFTKDAAVCLPELEVLAPPVFVLRVRFAARHVAGVQTATGLAKLRPAAEERFVRCVKDIARALTLDQHADTIEVDVRYQWGDGGDGGDGGEEGSARP